MAHKKNKGKFHALKYWTFSLEGLEALTVWYVAQNKSFKKAIAKKLQFLVLNNLDPDPNSPQSLDPDPDSLQH